MALSFFEKTFLCKIRIQKILEMYNEEKIACL